MAPYQAGLGARKITPYKTDVEAGRLYLWGYTFRKNPARWRDPGDEIWSRALALSDATGRCVVLVSLDLCALSFELVQAVRSKAL